MAKKRTTKKAPARSKTTGVVNKGSVTVVDAMKLRGSCNGAVRDYDLYRSPESKDLILRSNRGDRIKLVKTDSDIVAIADFLYAMAGKKVT